MLDAPDEAALAAAAGVSRVLVRVTLGVDADTHEAIRTGHHGSKFGLPPDQARELVADALERGLDGARAARPRRLAACRLRRAGRDDRAPRVLRGLVSRPARLDAAASTDLGGGFGIRHHPDDHVTDAAELAASAAATARIAFVEAGLPEPELWLEPGRSLVGRAGVTLYRVGAVKRLAHRTWVAVDGGMSDNPRPQLYDARYTALSASRARRAARPRWSASQACTASPATSSSTTSRCLRRSAVTCSQCPPPARTPWP